MAIKLKSIKISNYRSCRNTSLELNPQMNCLVGINGSGKSNILYSIELLRNLVAPERRYRRFEPSHPISATLNAVFQHGNREIYFKSSLAYSTDDSNKDRVVRSKQKWNLRQFTGKDQWIDIPLEFMRGYYGEQSYFFSSSGSKLKYGDISRQWYKRVDLKHLLPEKVFSIITEATQFIYGINYYSASQYTNPSECPASFYSTDETRNAYKAKQYTAIIKGIYDLYSEKNPDFELLTNVVGSDGLKLLEKIVFDEKKIASVEYEVRTGGKIQKNVAPKILVIPRIRIHGRWLSPNQLSDGTFKALALVFNLITDNSKLLLLEEPEICVHYGLLKSLIELLKDYSKKKQIIFSTHSELVLDLLKPENVYIVTNKDKYGTKSKILPKYLSKNHYTALKTYLAEEGNLGDYLRSSSLDND